jgi:hypothetical protein
VKQIEFLNKLKKNKQFVYYLVKVLELSKAYPLDDFAIDETSEDILENIYLIFQLKLIKKN